MPPTQPARLIALALLAACCAAFAPAPVYREPGPGRRTDEERLQGAWEQVGESFSGEAAHRGPGEFTAVFAGPRVSFLVQGEEMVRRSFRLDPAASPKRLDLRDSNGDLLRSIYRLEGDRLTLAYPNLSEAPRPIDFAGGPGICVKAYRRAKRGK